MKSPSWRVALVADGLVQRDGLPGVLLDLQHLLRGDVHLLGELLRRGLAAQVLEQLALDAAELVDDLDHVHRDADGAGLVGHRAGDGLADPPRRVGRELVALGVVELLDRTDQAEVALLDEVQERHAAAGVALGQRHDEAQVRLEQVVLGPLAVAHDPAQVAAHLRRHLLAGLDRPAQPLGRVEAGLDPLGELDLLLGVEQRDLADLLEVGADGVGRRGELGVLAGLPQCLGLLLVPHEVARLLRGSRGTRDGGADDRTGVGLVVLLVVGVVVASRCRPRPRHLLPRLSSSVSSAGSISTASSRSPTSGAPSSSSSPSSSGVVRAGLHRPLGSRFSAGLRRCGSRTGGCRLAVSRLRARGTAGTAGCGTRRLIDGRVGAGCGVCGCHLGPLATVRSPVTRMVDPRRRCVRCSPRRPPLVGLLDPRRVEPPWRPPPAGTRAIVTVRVTGHRPRVRPSCSVAPDGRTDVVADLLPAATRRVDRCVVGWCGERPSRVHHHLAARRARVRRSRGAAEHRGTRRHRGRRAPAHPAPAVGAAHGPVGRAGGGVDEEHADRRRHRLGHRVGGARARAAGAAAAGRPGGGGGGRRQRRGRGGDVGGRPDRRHGQLPLRAALVRRVVGGDARRGLARRSRRGARVGAAVERSPRRGGDLRRAAAAVQRRDRPRHDDGRHRVRLLPAAPGAPGRVPRGDAAAGARPAPERVVGAGRVLRGGRLARRLPRARPALVGLGRGGADRRGGGGRRAGAGPVRLSRRRRRTGPGHAASWRRPGWPPGSPRLAAELGAAEI